MPRAQLVVAREPPQQPIGRLYLPHKHSTEKGGTKIWGHNIHFIYSSLVFSIKSALAYRDHVISRSKPQHVVLSFTHFHRSRGSFRLSWVLPEALRLLSEPGEDGEGTGSLFAMFFELAMPLDGCRRVRFSKASEK